MNACKHISLLTVLLLPGIFAGAQTGSEQKVTVQVKNENAVNKDGLDFSPTFYEDGIVFISTNNAGLKKIKDEGLKLNAMSILRSRRNTDGELGAPEPFAKELSSQFHEGPVCFDRTAETVFFSRNVVLNGKEKLSKDGGHKMRLYMSKKEGGTWGEPATLPFNTNEFDDCHPAISIDGDKLFFASNRPGGFGGMDLYVAYKVGESWSEPVNLGGEVNTKGNEVFPFVHADNTLYFTSDGQKGGSGGFDLYYSTPDGNVWTAPVNLGEPFNTKGDDFGLIVDLNKINGYYSSNGNGGLGGDDIFSFHTENGNLDDYLLQNQRVPDRQLDLVIKVTDKESAAPVAGATVQILNLEAADAIGRDESGNLITIREENGQDVMRSMAPDKGINGSTDRKGKFGSDVKPGNYVILVAKDGYQSKQLRLPISKPGNEVNIALEKVSTAGKVHWNASLFNYMTNAPLAGATLVVTNKATGERDTVMADANGMVDYYLNENSKYKVDIYQGKRLVGSTDIDTSNFNGGGQVTNQNISVAPMLPGSKIELPNIYYNFNDATLRPDARKDLDMVAALMKQHEGITVELQSHTDARGSAKYNQELSQRRANGALEYLILKGINRSRLTPVGYGESQLRNNCNDGIPCEEADHARNRRTEVKIMAGVQGASMVYVDGQIGMGDEIAAADDPKVNKAPGVTVSTGEMDYYVIAGSFLMETRANNQVKHLVKLGYEEAEIVRFANSAFFSVCVRKCATRKEAEGLKRQLENKSKEDSFVRAVPKVQ